MNDLKLNLGSKMANPYTFYFFFFESLKLYLNVIIEQFILNKIISWCPIVCFRYMVNLTECIIIFITSLMPELIQYQWWFPFRMPVGSFNRIYLFLLQCMAVTFHKPKNRDQWSRQETRIRYVINNFMNWKKEHWHWYSILYATKLKELHEFLVHLTPQMKGDKNWTTRY